MSVLHIPRSILTTITAQTSQTATNSFQTLYSKTLPYGYLNTPGRQIRIRAWGTISWDASPPATFEFAVRYGGTDIWHFGGASGGALTQGYKLDVDAVTVSNGNVRAYGFLQLEGANPVISDIAIASTPTTSGAVAVAWGHTWASADAGSYMTVDVAGISESGLIIV